VTEPEEASKDSLPVPLEYRSIVASTTQPLSKSLRGLRLPSFSPDSGYPNLDLYRYVYLIRAFQDCFHPFDHGLLQPGLCVRRLLCITLDNHFVVANEYRDCPWAFAPTLPQEVCGS
jgi:hypothetical protein